MCGISGFDFADKDLIEQMVLSQAHRGPDSRGIYLDNQISLGHNRLSIIDLSAAGQQPMESEDGQLVIVYNGEIYNYLDLRQQLKRRGYKFFSRSDTEVLLKAYQEYGRDCLAKLRGIFAFAIWDRAKQELFCARDRFGVKPFFYYFDGQKFIFASEVKAILKHQLNIELNLVALNLYFRLLYINAPQTIWRNIYKLRPAHYLVYKNKKIITKQYWQISDFSRLNSWLKAKEKIKQTLTQAVRQQLVADVEVGVFLSGGIDSTIILGLANEHSRRPLKTFSVGFAVNQAVFNRFNEDLLSARQTAKHYQSEHYEIMLSNKDLAESLEKIVWHMDELVYSPTQAATLFLAKLARQKVKVVLGGDGGDELFGGYSRYYYHHLISYWQKLPRQLRQNLAIEKFFALLSKADIYAKINIPAGEKLYWLFLAQKEALISRFLRPEVNNLPQAQAYFFQFGYQQPEAVNDLTEKMMLVDLRTWLADYSLSRSDKMTMAVGLEQRVPFLTKELAELAFRLPLKYKIKKPRAGKLILKQALREYLPDFIYNKKKTGWFVPAARWLRQEPLKSVAYEILSPSYCRQTNDLFDFKQIREILDNHIAGRQYALNAIWSLINFQVWYKKFTGS